MLEKLIFELSSPGRKAYSLPECDVPKKDITEMIPEKLLRDTPAELPEMSELDVVRHFTRLSQLNFSVDTHFYPLGSCTMKYNPKINDTLASLEGFTRLHPYQPESHCQGILRLLYNFDQMLKEICGMDAFSLQPSAGAHGELCGMLIAHAYHNKNGSQRDRVIIPDSAHGTNPASAAMCGYDVVEIKSNKEGLIDLEELKRAMSDKVAALMITNPNTLGLFEKDILEISNIVHDAGGLLYCDGANMDALLGIARPGDMGVDILHLNLHKTFSTPHGGGGPGAGPIGVKENLRDFLPIPLIEEREGQYTLNYNYPASIGQIRSFYGNIGVIIRAYTYLLALGNEGLRRVGDNAVLNANYLRSKLFSDLESVNHSFSTYGERCMHEFVLSHKKQNGVSTLDIAKRLLDYGFHAPTIYFPLIVEESLMIEPTETESKETLDAFASALISIINEIESHPELVKGAPHTTPVARIDEVKAAREPNLRWLR